MAKGILKGSTESCYNLLNDYSKEVRKGAKIWIVDQLTPEDTVCVPFSDKVIDSLGSLVQYYGVHTYNMAHSHYGDNFSSMPGIGKGLQVLQLLQHMFYTS